MSTSIADDSVAAEEITTAVSERRGWMLYQTVRLILRPLRWWARIQVKGLEHLPGKGGALIVSNHDSWLDPLAIIEAMMWKQRQLRFLAKHTLWKFRPLAWILDEAAQIPIRRGESDTAALEAAVDAAGRGETIGIFPEGTLSRGTNLRARRGISRLARACPGTPVVLVAVTGGTDLKRFPKRPLVTVEFFEPAGGQPRPDEDDQEMAQRLLDEIRAKAPIAS
ncbi:MAG: 1-acyl-sn-glycerol-3-phosphate acyltransferase [Solirubrobacterales bacterium]|nr:1-acyl-sn-glycerol-3-phosphate acyltransferase [Solirubrobacterales bacterium]MCB0859689.1 1-acyl-sn-glycerol-3-phosphate acyltransferase [Solirubrobacterales bacterium]